MLRQVVEASYWFTAQPGRWDRGEGLGAGNLGQRLAAHFDPAGIAVRPASVSGEAPAWTWALEWAGNRTPPTSDGRTRVNYRRGDDQDEWFENKPEGLEHGFTLGERALVPEDGGMVRLALNIRTALAAEMTPDRRSVIFRDAAGETALRYENLLAYDARGRQLPATMELGESASDGSWPLALLVDAAGATFPITVDPLITRTAGTLNPSPPIAQQRAGWGVSLSGNLAALGAPGDYTVPIAGVV